MSSTNDESQYLCDNPQSYFRHNKSQKEILAKRNKTNKLKENDEDLSNYLEQKFHSTEQESKKKRLDQHYAPYGPKAEMLKKNLKEFTKEDEESSGDDNQEQENISDVIEEELQYMKEIKALLKSFFGDFEGSKRDIISGLLLLMAYRNPKEELTGNVINPEDPVWIEARYFMKFAAAAYGNTLALLKMKKKFNEYLWGSEKLYIPKGNKAIVYEHTGIKLEDLICSDWSKGVTNKKFNYLPGYYLCFDHETKSLILGIRGSNNLNDFLTDLVGNYEKYDGGVVHRGIFYMTNCLYNKLLPLILEHLDKFPEYTFVLSGHSLGAGVASLFALRFYKENSGYQHRVRAFCYACPATMDSYLSLSCKNYISSYVMGDDVVSRISYGSLCQLKETVNHILELSGQSASHRLYFALKQLTGFDSARLVSLMDSTRKKAKLKKSSHNHEFLYPPGKIYHYYQLRNGTIIGELSDYSKFATILISKSMFSDHMPHKYEKYLKCLASPYSRVYKAYFNHIMYLTGSCTNLSVTRNPIYSYKGKFKIVGIQTSEMDDVIKQVHRINTPPGGPTPMRNENDLPEVEPSPSIFSSSESEISPSISPRETTSEPGTEGPQQPGSSTTSSSEPYPSAFSEPGNSNCIHLETNKSEELTVSQKSVTFEQKEESNRNEDPPPISLLDFEFVNPQIPKKKKRRCLVKTVSGNVNRNANQGTIEQLDRNSSPTLATPMRFSPKSSLDAEQERKDEDSEDSFDYQEDADEAVDIRTKSINTLLTVLSNSDMEEEEKEEKKEEKIDLVPSVAELKALEKRLKEWSNELEEREADVARREEELNQGWDELRNETQKLKLEKELQKKSKENDSKKKKKRPRRNTLFGQSFFHL